MSVGQETTPMDQGRRLRVLISAYACEPGRGSEPGVGWNWAVQAARHHDVWVVTDEIHKHAIQEYLASRPHPHLRFTYHRVPNIVNRLFGILPSYIYSNISYRMWQLSAIPVARKLHTRIGFDLGHQVTYVSFRHPSFLAWLSIPFIWGPIGGGESAPQTFASIYGRQGRIRELLRSMSKAIPYLDPLVRTTSRRATTVVVATEQTRNILPKSIQGKVQMIPAIGTDVSGTFQSHRAASYNQLKLIYVGNLLYLKGIQLALPALARANALGANVSLTIVGDGPFRPIVEAMVNDLGIESYVGIKGTLTFDAVSEQLSCHDAMVFPSFSDSGGIAVLEAMAAQLPIVCLDLGGPAVSVCDECGLRIRADQPEQVIQDMSDAFILLARNTDLRLEMGKAGRRRVEDQYLWDRKGQILNSLYSETLEMSP